MPLTPTLGPPGREPEIAVVIPTLARYALLARVFARLEGQTALAGGAFEVIVAADAAEADLERVAHAVGARPFPVRIVQASHPGVSAARNRGWRCARAPVILFVGDDMLPCRALVGRHIAFHRHQPQQAIGMLGHVRWARELRITAFMRWLEHGMQFDYPALRRTGSAWWHFYAANASVKRGLLERVGGYDEAFQFGYEELDLALRMSEYGFELRYEPHAVVEHLHATSIESWQRRMRTVASAERQFVAKHASMEPYFYPMFVAATSLPPARGRAARLAGVVPRHVPVIGPRVWGSADAYYRQQLASAFLEAWNAPGEAPLH